MAAGEDSFVEDGATDTFVEDSFVADEPSKKKAVSQPVIEPVNQFSKDYIPEQPASASAAPSTSGIEQFSANPNIKPIVQGASPFIKEKPLTPKEQYEISGADYYKSLKSEINSLENAGKEAVNTEVKVSTTGGKDILPQDKSKIIQKKKELAEIEPLHEFSLVKAAVDKAKTQADNAPKEGDDALRPDGTPLDSRKISNIDIELNYIAQKSPAKALELSSQLKQGKASDLEKSELEAGGLAKLISVQGEELGAMERDKQASITAYQETQSQLEQINQLSETQGLTPEQAKAAEEIYAINQEAKAQIAPLFEKIGEYYKSKADAVIGDATLSARFEAEANAKRQAQTDNVYRNKNPFGQLLYNTGNVIEGGAISLLSGVAGLPRTIAPLFTSKDKQFEYDWTESLANSATRMTEKFMLEEPTKLQREAFEDVAKIGDYEVVVKNGKVQSVRDGEGYTIKDPTIVKSVSEQFKAEQPKVEMKGNVGAGTYGAFKALVDMGMTLMPVTGVTGRALKGLGMAEGLADFAGIYAGSMLLVNKHAYEAGIEAGLSPQLSSLYANGVAGIEAITESINPIEAQVARRVFGGATKMGAKEFAQTYISGAGLKSSLKKGAGSYSKNIASEGIIEEGGSQKLGQIQDVVYNKLAASSFDTEEALNDYLSAMAIGGGIGGVTTIFSNSARSQVEKEALALIIQDTPAAIENINKMIGKKVVRPDGKATPLTQEEADRITAEIQAISSRVQSIKDVSELDEEKSVVATDLVRRKMTLEEKLKGENIDDIAQKKYKDEISTINNQLEILTGLKRGEPYIEVDGEVMDEKTFKEKIKDEQFLARFEQGSHDVTIENNPKLVDEFQANLAALREQNVKPKENAGVKQPDEVVSETRETEDAPVTPKENDTVELPASDTNKFAKKLIFKDGKWQAKVGSEFSGVSEDVQKEAQGVFGKENISVKEAPEGHFINVGMLAGKTNKELSAEEILSKLPKGVEVLESKEVGGTEKTISIKLSRPLTDVEMSDLRGATEQMAIPQLSNKAGKIHGAKDWGEFNSDYFILPDGKPLSSPVKKSPSKLFSTPVKWVKDTVGKYKKKLGITTPEGRPINKIDEGNSKRIADAFEAVKHEPNNPEVKKAYDAMVSETVGQYDALKEDGIEFELYEGKGEPYANSEEMLADLEKKHLWVKSTESDFGNTPITEKQRQENPLLKDSGLKDKNGKPLLNNDVFRGVHDAIGHGERGNSFGAKGEENAWDVHARTYSPLARRAMTTETRGQNSWVNFGKHMRNEDGSIKKKGDKGYMPPSGENARPFAEQKIGLLPEEFSNLREEAPSKKQAKLTQVEEKRKAAAQKAIEGVKKALKSTGIEVVDDKAAYDKAVEEGKGQKGGEGMFVADDGKIYLNPEKFADAWGKTIVFHEGTHPVVNIIRNTNKKLYNSVVSGLNKAAETNPAIKGIKKWAEDNYDEGRVEDEFITETIAQIADGRIKLSEIPSSLKQKLIDYINSAAKLLGLGEVLSDTNLTEFKKLAEKVSSALKEGTDVSEIVGENNLDKYGFEVSQLRKLKERDLVFPSVKVPENPQLSLVKKSDLFDFRKLLDDIFQKGEKVFFWQADQLGKGKFKDSKGKEHDMDAGLGYALDPQNKKDGKVWATSEPIKTIQDKINQSSYTFIVSGSELSSKKFNKKVFDVFVNQVGDFEAFKSGVKKAYRKSVGSKTPILDILNDFNSWDELRNSPQRKDLLNQISKALEKQNTPLKQSLVKSGAELDYSALRDDFLRENNFKQNDIMLVLKPSEVKEGDSGHSTYSNTVYGKVVGVPDVVVNAFDILPSEKQQTEEGNIPKHRGTQSAKVAPYGKGLSEIQQSKGNRGKYSEDLVEKSGKRKEMTEDDNGNYLFFHYSDKKFDKLNPSKVGTHLATGRDERTAVPTSSLYTRPDRLEVNIPSSFGYISRVPKGRVYPFNEDPLNLSEEAEKRFRKENKSLAFDANNQLAYIAKVAAEKGYPVTVADWNIKGKKVLIAKTTEQIPLEKYTNIKAGTLNQTEFAEGAEDIKPNAKRRDIQYSKGNRNKEVDDYHDDYVEVAKFGLEEDPNYSIEDLSNDTGFSESDLQGVWEEATQQQNEANKTQKTEKGAQDEGDKQQPDKGQNKRGVSDTEVSSGVIFDKIEAADRSKKIPSEKKNAIKEALKDVEGAEKAIFVHENFEEIVKALQNTQDAEGLPILKRKCP